jgi:hypothetical protein
MTKNSTYSLFPDEPWETSFMTKLCEKSKLIEKRKNSSRIFREFIEFKYFNAKFELKCKYAIVLVVIFNFVNYF